VSNKSAMEAASTVVPQQAIELLSPSLLGDFETKLRQDIARLIKQTRAQAIEEAAQIAATAADEELPEPYWDNSRARRMDWACACGRILSRIRALAAPAASDQA
jgi:hypothetical protein